jgi:glycosyltransferase involved in cell wall biosynthesis
MLVLAGMLREQVRVAIICPPTPDGLRLLGLAEELGMDTLALEVRGDTVADAALGAWLARRPIDVFHAHAGIAWEGHAGVRVARAARVPTVVRTEHLPYLITDPAERDEYEAIVPSVDRFICVSESSRASFVRAGVPSSKIRVVRNGVRPKTTSCDRATARARLGLRPEHQVVLTVGRLTEQKGHRHLGEAIPPIVARDPNVRFLWAGGGPLEGELRDLVRRLEVADYVSFLGQRGDVPDLLAAADILVLPSLFEGLPLVVLEAMAAGLPVIGTRAGGTAEAIVDGMTGRVVPAGDSAALATALSDLVADPDRARAWGCAGRARFQRLFHARRMAHETSAIYHELLRMPEPDRALAGATG